jgi:polysaccharide biosynthesis transport protein
MQPRRQNQLPGGSGNPASGDRALAHLYPVLDVPAASAAPAAALDQLMRRLWRRKLAIAGAALLGTLAGLAVSKLQTPVFRAITTVQVEGFNQDHFLRDVLPTAPMVANASAQNYIENQVKILRSRTLAGRVAQKMTPRLEQPQPPSLVERLAADLGIRWPSGGGGDLTRRVQDSLSVRTSLLSQVIEIAFDDSDPRLAAAGANQAVDEFTVMNREARWQMVEDTAAALSRQTAELKAKLEKASSELQSYARASGLVLGEEGRPTLGEDRMRQLEDALGKAVTDRVAKQSRLEAATGSATQALPDSLVTGPLRQYQTELETARKELADALTLYTPAHYKVKRLEAQIAQLEKAIAREQTAIVGRLQTETNAAQRAEQSLSTARDTQLKSIQAESDRAAHYGILKREMETTQRLYDSVLEKTKEAGVASALGGANIGVIDRAVPPPRPYSPNVPLGAALGFTLGLIGGICLVIVREKPEKITRIEEVALPEARELGVIPSARHGLRSSASALTRANGFRGLELATWQDEGSWFAESFRATLASILFHLPESDTGAASRDAGRRGYALVITSVEPMEGKTMVLTNLGIACAETGRRVLLIDGDLRRPRLHDIFDVSNEIGLSDMVQRGAQVDSIELEAFLRTTGVPRLSVLPSGPAAEGIPGLLYSSALPELLDRLTRDFDVVLVDSPPMMLYPDARVLGKISDGVVLVVRANRTSRDDLVRTCYQVLTEDRTPILGTILNDSKANAAQSRTYTGYYNRYNRFNGNGANSR